MKSKETQNAPQNNGQKTEPLRTGSARVSCLAAFFVVNRSTIWRWVKAGKLPQPIKIGGTALWPWADIHAHIEELKEQVKQAASA